MNKKYFILSCMMFFCLHFFVHGQKDWTQLIQDPSVNFFEVQNAFEDFWKNKNRDSIRGWKQYKRWEHFTRFRIGPKGERINPALFYQELQQHNSNKVQALRKTPSRLTDNWTYIGNTTLPSNRGGAGRLNCIRFHPTDVNTLFAGAPSGGMWKSVDGGLTWTTGTDALALIGITDIAIDPQNPLVMYMATGDGDNANCYSIGVLKSTDGGLTWNPGGLSFSVLNAHTVSRLLIHPANPSVLIAATSDGVYRTSDAGVSWTKVLPASCKDMDFNPANANIVYAASAGAFYRSTDGGATFSATGAGLPASGVNRKAIAVTSADAGYVYVVACNSSNGFEGLYRSTDTGLNFVKMSSAPNILGWTNGSDVGGQGWYDLAIAASPTDKNLIYVGGVNIWKSADGGSSWSMTAHWEGIGAPYVHADIHDLVFYPGTNTLFAATDGGIAKTSNGGTNWTDLSSGLQIGQLYRLGISFYTPDILLTGWQDNGTNRKNASGWSVVNGGDGMECIVDYTNDKIMYASVYYGWIRKSNDGGNSFPDNIVNTGFTGLNEDGHWITPYILHPNYPTTILVGKSQVYRSTNGGTTFTQVDTLPPSSSKIYALAYAPSDPNYIYAAKSDTIFVSTDGNNFTDRSFAGFPANDITSIAVHQNDPGKVWITFSGYVTGSKVFYSSDAGVTWTNYSSGLPNLPANTIVYQNNSTNVLYVGTDVGVYYRDSTMSSWQSYSNNLPNVIVDELEIFYNTPPRLRAATYGRGIWETPLVASSTTAPVAQFISNINAFCPGKFVQFREKSKGYPTSWSWLFPGGSPAASTLPNPVIYYNVPGIYDVTLIVSNSMGSDTLTYKNMINVFFPPTVVAKPDTIVCTKENKIFQFQLNGTTNGISYTWTPTAGLTNLFTLNPVLTTSTTRKTVLKATSSNGCISTDTASVIISNYSSMVSGSNGSVCDNDSATISAIVSIQTSSNSWSGSPSFGTYTWSPAYGLSNTTIWNPKAKPSVTTTYTVSAIATYTTSYINLYCNSTNLMTCEVVVTISTYPPIPTITISGDTLISSPGDAYQWYRNGVLIGSVFGQKFLHVDSAIYVVAVTINGCTTFSYPVKYVSVDELNDFYIFNILPNPNDGYFELNFVPPDPGNYAIEIRNTLGQMIYEEKLSFFTGQYKKSLDISAYGKGVYFFSIRSGNGRGVKKVVVY